MLISVIVPIYNKGTTLRKCINSITNQDFQNLQIILVNDGSLDNSLEICLECKQRDNRIEVYDQLNQGVSSARNLGYTKSRGDYIYFMDPDDYLLPDCFSFNVKFLKSNSIDILIFGHIKKKVNKEIKLLPYKDGYIDPEDLPAALSKLFKSGCGFSVWEKLIKRSFVAKHKISFPPLKRGQDMYYSALLFQNKPNLYLVKKSFYIYRMQDDQSKYDNNLFLNYLKIFIQFASISENYGKERFVPFLFVKWFAFVIPYNIIGNTNFNAFKKIKEINKVYNNHEIKQKIKSFNLSDFDTLSTKLLFSIIRSRSAGFTYLLISLLRLYRKA